MADINAVLNQRVKTPSNNSKMAAMAKQSASGNLTSFAGVFGVSELSDHEKQVIENLLRDYCEDENTEIHQDLQALISITSEVKAINNQAALLHGERIKRAHHILTRYRNGAFTAWLMTTYGNRQTPYNLMQYYEFYEVLPKGLRPQLESMPRQAIYVLASRPGSVETKQSIVESYKGETKEEMLFLIRRTFPLNTEDKRHQKTERSVIKQLHKIIVQMKASPCLFSPSQKEQVHHLLDQIHAGINS